MQQDTAAIQARTAADDPADVVALEPDIDGSDGSDLDSDAAKSATAAARRINFSRLFVYAVLPGVAFLLALGAGYLKWQESSARDDETAGIQSAQAAKDATIALLSYQPNTVDQQLGAARDLLTGDFRQSYTKLTTDVVIPGAKQKQISAVATVPAVASVSATENHAVALVFVNETTVIGTDAPTAIASSIRVTMDKVRGRWLISAFDPV